MRASHPQAENLFGRLTSFTAKEDSNRIENLCTEALAWCLLSSPAFRGQFLAALGLADQPCTVHTQHSYLVGQEEEDVTEAPGAKNRGIFDLLLTGDSAGKGFVAVCEVKVWSGFGENQAKKYAQAAKKLFPHGTPLLVSITPFPDRPAGFGKHLQWWRIARFLENMPEGDPLRPMLQQFAGFLKHRGLGMMKLDPLDPKTFPGWHRTTAMQAQWAELFALFGIDPELKKIFKKETGHPIPERDPKRARSWLGIHSPGAAPRLYAGLAIMETGEAMLWVELIVAGKHAKAVVRLPESLKPAFGAATLCLDPAVDRLANVGLSTEEGETSFGFAQPVTPEFNGKPERTLAWFRSTIVGARDFATKDCP